MQTARVRPGIYFETAAAELPVFLPRMDIAAFVGFAASGPLHQAVAVESGADFRDIFGEAAPLALDPETGRPAPAQLAGSVRAFFRNGGRRCRVIRVADTETATTQVFQLPGLVAFDPQAASPGGAFAPAVAVARAPGSWADGVRLSTVAVRNGLPLAADPLSVTTGGFAVQLAGSSGGDLAAGDLIRLAFRSAGGELLDCHAPLASPPSQPQGSIALDIALADCLWLAAPADGDGIADIVLADRSGAAEALTVQASAEGAVDIDLPSEIAPPQVGAVLPVRFASGDVGAALVAETARPEPIDRPRRVRVTPGAIRRRIAAPPAIGDLTLLQAERLGFAIRAEGDAAGRWRLDRLGLTPVHPRFWRALPDDATLYPQPDAPDPDRRAGAGGPLVAEASVPRFPLAGPPASDALPASAIFLPFGMAIRPDAAPMLTAIGETDPETRLRRDGLADFSDRLFLDPDLAPRTARSLQPVATDKRYARDRRLRGLHGVFFVNEVTLLAVPDAGHPGWQPDGAAPVLERPLTAPTINSFEPTATGGSVDWGAVDGAQGYALQWAADAAFEALLGERELAQTTADIAVSACPQRVWVRVRALHPTVPSPWSNTVGARLPASPFTPKDELVLAAPAFAPLAGGATERPLFTLQWGEVEGAARYRVQEAVEPLFGAPAEATVDGTSHVVTHGVDRIYFYRVRAEIAPEDGSATPFGPWSPTLVVTPPPVMRSRMTTRPVAAGALPSPVALAVHAAMLRLGLARGDVFSLLSLPRGTGAASAEAHRRALTAALAGEGEDALSFAALYLPWLQIADGAGRQAVLPPDGSMAGLYAHRALTRGAWIAPANRLLADVVAADKAFSDADRRLLFDAQLNLLTRHPDGFRAMTADTLSPDDRLRPVNVRRLIMLIRRLALREGNRLVFEPNDRSVRNRLRMLFEELMRRLYVAGAFAGAGVAEAFRVVADETVNPPASLEAGRLIVELRIAPSRPTEFLIVRLLQDAERNLLAVEA